MKKLFSFLVCLVSFASVHATHFYKEVTITPLNHSFPDMAPKYLAEIQLMRSSDQDVPLEILCAPKIYCIQGETARISMESDDKKDLTEIEVLVQSQDEAKVIILIKENNQVVLSTEEMIKIKQS